MVRENLARKFHSAGFEQPEGSRKKYVKPRAELQKAFYKWVKELPNDHDYDWKETEKQHRKALSLISYFHSIEPEETNSLIAGFNPETEGQREVGLFISACYTKSLEPVIIFDNGSDEIVDYIGYRLPKGKVLVNNGIAGCWFAKYSSGIAINNKSGGVLFGSGSSGIAINNGEIENHFANCSRGIAINNGDVGMWFANSSSGIVIAIDEPKSYGDAPEAKVLKPTDCERIPELKKYLDELHDLTKSIKDEQSAKRFLERYGPVPRERIKQNIKEMLEEGGHGV